ncbi:MAG: YraN family protein [Alphaproteobacteria bacterium]|nr:YraN family protein [Alphaproteobacteria bacterium]MBF0251670.1 YraN family protein [Alphaproteobacteria bacterium]
MGRHGGLSPPVKPVTLHPQGSGSRVLSKLSVGEKDGETLRRKSAQRRGRWAETLTALVLRLTGHRILARNVKTRVGEIDIVARRGNTVSFVEVKTRRDAGDGFDAVTPRQRGRIQRAAEGFLIHNPALQTCDIRFDVCVVDRPWRLRFVRDAWRPGDA